MFLLFKHCVFAIVAPIIMALTPSVATAQQGPNPQWKQTQTAAGIDYKHEAGDSIISMIGLSASQLANLNVTIENTIQTLIKSGACPGFERARIQIIYGGEGRHVRHSSNASLCSITAVKPTINPKIMGAVGIMLVSVDSAQSSGKADRLTNTLLHNITNQSFSPATVATPSPQRSITAIDAKLRSRIAAVPVANRPVAMVILSERRLIGTLLVNTNQPWLIFANGVATSCFDWNPLKSNAANSPAFYQQSKNCEVTKWRKTGVRYEIFKEGEWVAQINDQPIKPATDGARLSLDLESASGNVGIFNAGSVGAAGGFIDGGGAVGTVTLSDLTMTSNGEYKRTQDSYGFDKFTSSESSGVQSGRYHLNGYLMALHEPSGKILIGFFGKPADIIDSKGRPYKIIYLNGIEFSSKASR